MTGAGGGWRGARGRYGPGREKRRAGLPHGVRQAARRHGCSSSRSSSSSSSAAASAAQRCIVCADGRTRCGDGQATRDALPSRCTRLCPPLTLRDEVRADPAWGGEEVGWRGRRLWVRHVRAMPCGGALRPFWGAAGRRGSW